MLYTTALFILVLQLSFFFGGVYILHLFIFCSIFKKIAMMAIQRQKMNSVQLEVLVSDFVRNSCFYFHDCVKLGSLCTNRKTVKYQSMGHI